MAPIIFIFICLTLATLSASFPMAIRPAVGRANNRNPKTEKCNAMRVSLEGTSCDNPMGLSKEQQGVCSAYEESCAVKQLSLDVQFICFIITAALLIGWWPAWTTPHGSEV